MFDCDSYREIDPVVPDELIERMVSHGLAQAHPRKPGWIKATPRLNRVAIKGLRKGLRQVSEKYGIAVYMS